MNDASQLVTAMLAIVFAAVLLVSGQLYMQYTPRGHLGAPVAAVAKLSHQGILDRQVSNR